MPEIANVRFHYKWLRQELLPGSPQYRVAQKSEHSGFGVLLPLLTTYHIALPMLIAEVPPALMELLVSWSCQTSKSTFVSCE